MKVIQVSLDDKLLAALDSRIQEAGGARSAFVRDAVAEKLKRISIREKERLHREGYQRSPIEPGEFDLETDDESWPEW